VKRVAAVVLVLVLAACSGGGDDTGADDASPEKTTTTPPLHATEDLADGEHFGFVTALDPTRFRLVFDEAELLTGDEAAAAAAADGKGVNEDGSYVRNPDDRMNRVTLSEDLVVRLLKPCCDLHEVSFQSWLDGFEPDDRTFFGTADSHYRITIEDQTVVEVDEVYLP
jgi:hypothetical protein